MFLSFSGVEGVVALENCDELFEPIQSTTSGWPSKAVPSGEKRSITISPIQGGYSRVSKWTQTPSKDDDVADALCDFVSDLIDAYLDARPDMLALHAAAVEINGNLVVFPTRHKSGKSLLCVQLAAMGVPVFSDDVLPLDTDTNHGMALGIAPRLRLPLPDNVTPDLHEYLDKTGMVSNQRYAYVNLPEDVRPSLETRCPIQGIINLCRQDGREEAELIPLPGSQAVKMVIERNLGFRGNAAGVIDRICDIAETATCYELRYGDPRKAAQCLIDAF